MFELLRRNVHAFAVCFCFAVGRALLAAPPPVITSVSPAPLTVFSYHTSFALTINGNNFWPGGPNNPDRWEIDIARQYLPFQMFRSTAASNNVLRVEFDSFPLLGSVGQLQVMVKVDGVSSNVFSVKILDVPPSLVSVAPNQIPLNGPDASRWNVWVAGDNWLTKTSIWVNGAEVAPVYNYRQQQFVWPASLRKAGTYGVQVKNERGSSEVRNLQVLAPTPSIKVTDTIRQKDSDVYKAFAPTHTPTPSFSKVKARANVFHDLSPKPTPHLAQQSDAPSSKIFVVHTPTVTPTSTPTKSP